MAVLCPFIKMDSLDMLTTLNCVSTLCCQSVFLREKTTRKFSPKPGQHPCHRCGGYLAEGAYVQVYPDRKFRLLTRICTVATAMFYKSSTNFVHTFSDDGSFVRERPGATISLAEIAMNWVYHALSTGACREEQMYHSILDVFGNIDKPANLPAGVGDCSVCRGSGLSRRSRSRKSKKPSKPQPCPTCLGSARVLSPVLTPRIVSMAESVYASATWHGQLPEEDMNVLADHLYDVWPESLTAEPNLFVDHLREPGPHFLGCWAIDVLARKVPS